MSTGKINRLRGRPCAETAFHKAGIVSRLPLVPGLAPMIAQFAGWSRVRKVDAGRHEYFAWHWPKAQASRADVCVRMRRTP
jgi:hypothetical protein